MAAEPENPVINTVEPPAPPTESEIPAAAATAVVEAINEQTKTPVPKPKGKKRKSKAPRDVTAPRQPLTGKFCFLN